MRVGAARDVVCLCDVTWGHERPTTRGTAQHSAGLTASLTTLAAGVAGVVAPEADAILGGWIATENHPGIVSTQRRGDLCVSHPR